MLDQQPDDRPTSWETGRPNLIAAYPAHIPMGLPLPNHPISDHPVEVEGDGRPDAEFTL